VKELFSTMDRKAQMDWRLAMGFGAGLLILGGCASSGDVDAVRRDVNALRQEVAGLARANEGARAFTEERLSRLERDLRSRFESTVKESEGSRTALSTRLEELGTETRLVQGKLEENAFALSNLNNRLDEIDQRARQTASRVDGLDQQVKTLGQQLRAVSPPPPGGSPSGQSLPQEPSSGGQPPNAPPPAGQAPGAQPPVTQPPAGLPPVALPAMPPVGAPVAPPSSGPSAGQPTAPVAPSVPPSAPAPARPPQQALLPPEDVYRNALNDYTKGNYDLAIVGFRTYIQNYPKTSLIPNAQYWLGESYYSQKNYAQAVEEFDIVIRDYPDNPKVPSALFKQGDAYLQMNDTQRATVALCELMAKYPKTREARLARERNIRCRS
jgi:tol-pal system protein YbgF